AEVFGSLLFTVTVPSNVPAEAEAKVTVNVVEPLELTVDAGELVTVKSEAFAPPILTEEILSGAVPVFCIVNVSEEVPVVVVPKSVAFEVETVVAPAVMLLLFPVTLIAGYAAVAAIA